MEPGHNALQLVIATEPNAYPWIHLRLEYISPLGAQVTQDYLGPTDPQNARYRLHRVVIRAEGEELLRFDVDLGPYDEPDPGRPAVWGGAA